MVTRPSKLKIVFLVLVVVWMGVIFAYSARTAEDSTEQSRWLGKLFGSIVVADWDDWTPEQQEAFADKWDHPIRKAAHMAEYAILGALLCALLISWPFDLRKALYAAILIGIFYAATDEFHQLFVPGRAGMLSDVGIDSVGVVIGSLLSRGMHLLAGKTKKADV